MPETNEHNLMVRRWLLAPDDTKAEENAANKLDDAGHVDCDAWKLKDDRLNAFGFDDMSADKRASQPPPEVFAQHRL